MPETKATAAYDFVVTDFRFPLDQLREMHLRCYNLRGTALEFFLMNNTNYFVNFDPGIRDKVPVFFNNNNKKKKKKKRQAEAGGT